MTESYGVLNKYRAGNSGLGNRLPNKFGSLYNLCPLCLHDGLMMKLNEEHVIASCPVVSYDRDVLEISAYFHAHSAGLSRKFKVYLGVTMHPQQLYIDGLA